MSEEVDLAAEYRKTIERIAKRQNDPNVCQWYIMAGRVLQEVFADRLDLLKDEHD